MGWVNNLIGRFTRPQLLFKHLNGSFWTDADSEELEKHDDPMNLYIYQRMERTKWGKWFRVKDNFLILTENRYQYAKTNLISI